MGFFDQLAHAFDAFKNQEPRTRIQAYSSYGAASGIRPDRSRGVSGDRSIISSIQNRIAVDAAALDIKHVRLNEDRQYVGDIESNLNTCLTLDANIDQAGRAFRQDMVQTLLEKGTIAIVPVETTGDPMISAAYDINSLRVGEIVSWFPGHVRVNVYNEKTGRREEITLAKKYVAIVESPLYTVMNEPNGTLQRLIRKLSLLDTIDEQTSSGKLDMIIQLPYTVKTDVKREQAEIRRADIENQLKNSKYGVAYTDGVEKITQLNRPLENNMLKQVEYLTALLYGQLGLTKEVFDGTASEAVMLNYYNRTIEPILTAIVESMRRSFLTKTARTQRQSIEFFRDPFKLVPVGVMAEIADKFSRNEILTSNEIRMKIGMKPAKDPKANQLINSNMPQATLPPVDGGTLTATPSGGATPEVEAEPTSPADTPISVLMDE